MRSWTSPVLRFRTRTRVVGARLQRLGVEVVAVRERLRVPVAEGPEEVQRVVAGAVVEVAVVVVGEGRAFPASFLCAASMPYLFFWFEPSVQGPLTSPHENVRGMPASDRPAERPPSIYQRPRRTHALSGKKGERKANHRSDLPAFLYADRGAKDVRIELDIPSDHVRGSSLCGSNRHRGDRFRVTR